MSIHTHSSPDLVKSVSPSKHEAAFAIVRVDEFLGPDVPVERKITIKKVMWDEASATAEIQRLNSLQRDSGVRYFLQITRVQKPERPLE